MDCCNRMLTSSTALGEMSRTIQRRTRFSAATHAVAQPQTEEGQPKGAVSENSPPLFPNESVGPSSSRESRRRLALNLLLPTFVRGGRGRSAWPGDLRFGKRGYSEHRMVLVTRLPLYCTAPRQLRIFPLLDEGDSIPILILDDRFSTIPALTSASAPRWCVEWCRGACPIWTPERGSSFQIAFATWGRKKGPW